MKIVKHIPNTITSMNLICGVMGVIFTFKGNPDIAFYLMLAAALCDLLDGMSARALNAYSDLGKQLDSLADMISFGVLPAIMCHRLMYILSGDTFWCYTPLLIAVFSAVRLAKFNIDERQSENFIGLATPACAMLAGAFVFHVSEIHDGVLFDLARTMYFIPAASSVLSLLLVSEIPMFSMKFKKGSKADSSVHKMRISFLLIALITCIMVPILKWHISCIVMIIFVAYILMNVGHHLIPRKR